MIEGAEYVIMSMTKEQFIKHLVIAIPEGLVFDNLGGGISTIIKVGEDKLSYTRGKSRFYLSYGAIFDALKLFSGTSTTTTDLKQHNPEVFDSKRGGHSCNCTTMFKILERMGLIDGTVQGAGRKGSPFFVLFR